MRQAITIQKNHSGAYTVLATPEVPYDEQKAEFHNLPASKSEHATVAEVLFVPLTDNGVAKRKTYRQPESKPKAAKKKATSNED